MMEISSKQVDPSLIREFEPTEFEARRRRLAELMRVQDIDAFLINSEANHRYFTGHWTGRWTSRTRPVMLLINRAGKATILCSVVEEGMARICAANCDVKVFGGTGYDLDPSLKALANELRTMGLSRSRIAAELGTHQRPQMPPSAFGWLRDSLPEMALLDGSDLLWKARGIKSPAEIVYLKKTIEITQQMFDRVPNWLASAKDERAVFHQLCVDTLMLGADQVGYFNVVADITQRFSGGFTSRPIEKHKVVYIDAGCIIAGYWSDYDRLFAVGRPDGVIEDYYERLWDVTEEAIEAVKPGLSIRELYAIVREATGRVVGELPMLGRVGHSIGLDMPEPPSICPEEDWVIEPGMVLNLEPSLKVPGGGNLVAEESVLVTKTGAEILTRRAPNRIPKV